MKHMNRFGKGKEQRPRIRIRILRGYGGYGVGAIISPPAGATQILLAKKDQLGRPVAEIVPEPELVANVPPEPKKEPEASASKADKPAPKPKGK